MAGQIFLTVVSGIKQMARGLQASAGAGSAGQLVALNSAGQIDSTMLPASATGATTATATATAACTAGMFGHYYYSGGVLNVKPADNTTTGSEANCFLQAAIANGQSGTITLSGLNTSLSGLTDGLYFLGAAGAITQTPPTTAGYILQEVGRPTSATALEFQPTDPITVA